MGERLLEKGKDGSFQPDTSSSSRPLKDELAPAKPPSFPH